MKSPNLRHCQDQSQNKELSEYQRRACRLQTGPTPSGDKQAAGGGGEVETGSHYGALERAGPLPFNSPASVVSAAFWPGALGE